MARTMRDRWFGKYAMEATITVAEQVTPTMRRIRLETDQPIAFPYTPGQHIRIQLKDPLSMSGILRPAETLRTYTIWDLDPARTAIELRVHLYAGDGIGLTWARAAQPGDRTTFWWPQGDFFTREAAYHVFIGEETAGAGYVAGEARTCQLVRDFLVRERNWPRTSIKTKPFWAPGKRGLH